MQVTPCKGRESGIQNPGKFCFWNPESWVLEYGIPLTIGIRIPSSTDKDWNPVRGIRNPRMYPGITLSLADSFIASLLPEILFSIMWLFIMAFLQSYIPKALHPTNVDTVQCRNGCSILIGREGGVGLIRDTACVSEHKVYHG